MKDVKILCIDDDEDIRFALGELFAMQNWKSYAASSVAKGLEIFRRDEPDIVLIDYHMPGINGVEGVKLIRTFSPSVPIIVFTIDEEQEIADRFLEAGATDFALKPLKAPDLISRIRLHLRLLEQSRAFRTAPRLDKGLSEETMQVVLDTMREAKEEMTMEAIRTAAPVMGILMGVGMFIEVMTATGVRGLVVTSCLRLPPAMWLLACAVSIPLFGAVSSYGACSVLGVPFAYIYASLLGGNSVVVLAAISLIASCGDMMPPTALAGLFAAQVTGVKEYTKILRRCLVPMIILLVWACFFLAKSKMIAGLF